MRLLGLADALRAEGLEVVEVNGWRTRGDEFSAMPLIPIAHHTATSAKAAGDYPSLGIVRDGRPDLRGPLSQLGLGRSGKVYVIASGKANHAGRGAWRGVTFSARTVGVEAESPGDGTWTPAQRAAYPRVLAALCRYLRVPAENVCGHREWALPAGRKPDPTGIDLPTLRRDVARILAAPPGGTKPAAPAADPVLRRGDSGPKVRDVQHALWHLGNTDLVVAGEFAGATEALVRLFQHNRGLTVDGIVGKDTWAALRKVPGVHHTGPCR